MNQFVRIRSFALRFFFIGFAAGFLITLTIPEIGRLYYAFQLRQAERLATIYRGPGESLKMVSEIFLRNLSIACLIALLPVLLVYQTLAYRKRRPYKSGDYRTMIRKELSFVLTLYSTTVLLAYGFFVFGIFLASVFARDSFRGLVIWILYLVPHGILETSVMIMAAATGIAIRDNWLRNRDPAIYGDLREVFKHNFADYLAVLAIVLLLSAFLEVYVSKDLMRLLISTI